MLISIQLGSYYRILRQILVTGADAIVRYLFSQHDMEKEIYEKTHKATAPPSVIIIVYLTNKERREEKRRERRGVMFW